MEVVTNFLRRLVESSIRPFVESGVDAVYLGYFIFGGTFCVSD
jgi:hypothetical protein